MAEMLNFLLRLTCLLAAEWKVS